MLFSVRDSCVLYLCDFGESSAKQSLHPERPWLVKLVDIVDLIVWLL